MDEMELKRPTTRRSRAPLFFAVVLLLGVFGIVYSLREDIATLTNGMLSNRPNGRTRPTLFINHREYQTLNREDDYLWDALLPDNGGFLWQEEDDGVRHVHGISMLHQLHCLQMIRTQMMDFKEKTEDGNKMHHTRGAHQHHGEGYKHVLHCLDYLRQVSLFRQGS